LETEWFFITGADALADIMEWRGPQEVIALAHIIGVTRPGHEMRHPDLPADSWTLLEIPAMAISSTNIRARAGRGEPINYLVPESVANFIGKRKLYQ
jgi:nicotinate-nucleotide adenylyltransferase